MLKLHQHSWQDIQFRDFVKLSAFNIADSTFYAQFYKAFYQKYNNWDEISPSWQTNKKHLAYQIIKIIQDNGFNKNHAILSIGCGLGFIEKIIFEAGFSNLEVTEITEQPLRWLQTQLPPEQIHVGFVPECLPPNQKYDFIYLNAVDYVFETQELIHFLRTLRDLLQDNGIVFLSSASFQPEITAFDKFKEIVKQVLHSLKLYDLGQLWGYIRSRQEYYEVMKKAELYPFEDFLLENLPYHIVYKKA